MITTSTKLSCTQEIFVSYKTLYQLHTLLKSSYTVYMVFIECSFTVEHYSHYTSHNGKFNISYSEKISTRHQ